MRPGAQARAAFAHPPEVTYLNHGSFGSVPREVTHARRALQDRQASNPFDFIVRQAPGLLRQAAVAVAPLVGAHPNDVVWTDNATTGINAVLRGLSLAPGDELLTTSHVYDAVRHTLTFVAVRAGAQVRVVDVPFPPPADDALVRQVADAITPRTRIAVLDQIASKSGLRLPIEGMTAVCRDAGVPVLIDAAHALGQDRMAVDTLGAQWVVANAHKWLYTPLSAAMLWVDPAYQAETHPTTISHGYGGGLVAEFDYTGTRDVTAAAVVPDAVAFIDALGGLDALNAYTAALVDDGAARCARRWGVELPLPRRRRRNLATLPWPGRGPATVDAAREASNTLWETHRIVVPVFPFVGKLWVRLSAAAYNTEDDYRQLAEAVSQVVG